MELPQAVSRMTGRAYNRSLDRLSLDFRALPISTGDGLRHSFNLALRRRRRGPGLTLLGAPWGRRVSYKRDNLTCQGLILVAFGAREDVRDLPPRIKCCLTAR